MASGPTLPPQAYTREILTAAFNWLQAQPESVRKLATTPDALVGLYMRAQRFGNSNLESDAPVSSANFMSDLKNLAEGLKQFEGPRDGSPGTPTGPAAGMSSAPYAFGPNGGAVPPSSHVSATNPDLFASGSGAYMNGPSSSFAGSTSSQGFAAPSSVHSNFAPSPQPPPLSQPPPAQAAPQPPPQSQPQPQTMQQYAQPQRSYDHGRDRTFDRPHERHERMHEARNLNERSLAMIHEVRDALNLSSETEVINLLVGLGYKSVKGFLN